MSKYDYAQSSYDEYFQTRISFLKETYRCINRISS
jgi:hypothetical protein